MISKKRFSFGLLLLVMGCQASPPGQVVGSTHVHPVPHATPPDRSDSAEPSPGWEPTLQDVDLAERYQSPDCNRRW